MKATAVAVASGRLFELRASKLLALALFAGCGAPPPSVRLLDLRGDPHEPMAVAPGSVHVLVFSSPECPIANAYAPTLQQLAAAWAGQPVKLFLVHPDPDVDATAAARHAVDYALPGTVLLDPNQQLARAVGVTRTPEAAVLGESGLLYRGRIDDQWRALGVRAASATEHDLATAVKRALAGGATPAPWPAAVGCLLPEPRR